MALVGAANVAGSNPTGTGSNLQAIGNSRYVGFSGQVMATENTNGVLFDFSTGAENLEMTIQWSFNSVDLTSSKLLGLQVKLNGELIIDQVAYTDNAANNLYDIDPFFLYVPAFSRVEIESFTNDADNIRTYAVISAKGI